MAGPVWVKGLGDSLLSVVYNWVLRWPYGVEAGTRPYLRHDGKIEDIVTLRAVEIDWDVRELKYLLQILEARKPNWYITEELRSVVRNLHRARLLPGGRRRISMVTYEDEPKQIFEELLAFRDGKETGSALADEVTRGDFWAGTA